MTEPEPLKGKTFPELLINSKVATINDIKSAVEWLKGKLYERESCDVTNTVIPMIDEAFEDVIKEK